MDNAEENDLGADLGDGTELVLGELVPGDILRVFMAGMANDLELDQEGCTFQEEEGSDSLVALTHSDLLACLLVCLTRFHRWR